MGWLISDNEMDELNYWKEQGVIEKEGLLDRILRRAIPVKVEDVHDRPLRWIAKDEEDESEPDDEG